MQRINTGSQNILVNEPLLTMACVSLAAVSKSPLALEAAASQLMCYNPLPLFFLALLTLAASAPWSPATQLQLQVQVQVGFNLWWQQLYWAMNSPAPTHLLLHRGTSGHQINHLFVIYLVIWNLCPFLLPFFCLYKFLSVFISNLILHFPTNLMSYVCQGVWSYHLA